MKKFTYKQKTNSWEVINIYPMTQEDFDLMQTGTQLDKVKFLISKEAFEKAIACSEAETTLCNSVIEANKPVLSTTDVFELLTANLHYKDDVLETSNFSYGLNSQYQIKVIS